MGLVYVKITLWFCSCCVPKYDSTTSVSNFIKFVERIVVSIKLKKKYGNNNNKAALFMVLFSAVIDKWFWLGISMLMLKEKQLANLND